MEHPYSEHNYEGLKSPLWIKTIKKHLNTIEVRNLVDSYFYSVLYYNASIWLTPSLSADLKQKLSVSSNALRSCVKYHSYEVSFEELHKNCKKVHQIR